MEAVDAVVHDLSLMVSLDVQNGHLRSVVDNETCTLLMDELIGTFCQILREAVDAEIDGSEILDVGVIGEDANIGAGSEAAEPIDQLDVIGLEEDEIGSDFKRKGDNSQGLSVSNQVSFLVFEDALVGSGHFCLLGNLTNKKGTILSIRAA
jgi:hypothetical protein